MVIEHRIPLIYSHRVRLAAHWSEHAHRGINRKAGDFPYFHHLVAVVQLLSATGADDDLLCAGFLHDTVEDTDVTLLEIADTFGGRVSTLVDGVTKVMTVDGRKPTKAELHEDWMQRMARSDHDVVALKAADLIANISDLIFDQSEHGYRHWDEMFGERAPERIGQYIELADLLVTRLSADARYGLLADTLRERAAQLAKLLTSRAA